MSAQELVACLCREGDQHLALGETPLATAFYLAAFSCHAPSALRSVRAALPETRGSSVVATLVSRQIIETEALCSEINSATHRVSPVVSFEI